PCDVGGMGRVDVAVLRAHGVQQVPGCLARDHVADSFMQALLGSRLPLELGRDDVIGGATVSEIEGGGARSPAGEPQEPRMAAEVSPQLKQRFRLARADPLLPLMEPADLRFERTVLLESAARFLAAIVDAEIARIAPLPPLHVARGIPLRDLPP